jgi:hypothetical protein
MHRSNRRQEWGTGRHNSKSHVTLHGWSFRFAEKLARWNELP